MKTRIAYVLFALTVLAAAGFAWAAQPSNPAEHRAESPEVSVPANDAGIVSGEIGGLFVEPVETGACCVADCYAAYDACWTTCDVLDSACWEQCWARYGVCLSRC